MKFEIKLNYFHVSDSELIADIKHVAKKLRKRSITLAEYKQHGKFYGDTASKRFGGWKGALEKAGLMTDRKAETAKLILLDIQRAARKLKKQTISTREYLMLGNFSVDVIKYHFGSWENAVNSAGLTYKKYHKPTKRDLLENLKNAWLLLGRQPLCKEMKQPLSAYGKNEYAKQFGSWNKALLAFAEYVNQDKSENGMRVKINEPVKRKEKPKAKKIRPHKTPRTINYKMRHIILERDSYRCCACGRSPANEDGVKLQIDHIKPWSQGGETIPQNLQTLCMECNIGKGDL